MKKVNNKKGFTIVELVIVIAVIAILAAVLIPTFSGVVDNANKTAALEKAKNSLTAVLTATEGKFAGSYYFAVIDKGDKVYWFVCEDGSLNESSAPALSGVNFTANDVIYVSSNDVKGTSGALNFETVNSNLKKVFNTDETVSTNAGEGTKKVYKSAEVSLVPDAASGVVIIPKKSNEAVGTVATEEATTKQGG